ncbi:MAG: arsenate reductase family protein [Gemmatimonadota bacterium]
MMRLLRESGVDFEAVDYTIDPIPRGKLADLVRKMGISPRELLRKRERAYRDLDLGREEATDDEILDAMAEHPELVQRPIVERGERAVLGRPPERVRELF